MKDKGAVKRFGRRPNFWGNYRDELPKEFKEVIYHQYYSHDTCYVYCDCSMPAESNIMSIACSYVQNGSVTVKGNIIYPPKDCWGKNTYGELQAIMFGLLHFEKHMYRYSKNLVIYSDVDHVTNILNSKVPFKKVPSLRKLQPALVQLFEQKQVENPHLNISIEYLTVYLKNHNPFAKSAHNAARKLLQKQGEANY